MSSTTMHGLMTLVEALAGNTTREAVLSVLVVATLLIAGSLANVAIKRKQPRSSDLWLIVAITLSMLTGMVAYSGAVLMLVA